MATTLPPAALTVLCASPDEEPSLYNTTYVDAVPCAAAATSGATATTPAVTASAVPQIAVLTRRE